MVAKKRLLLAMYYLPVVMAVIRTGLTIWFFWKNPLGMPLRYLQFIPLIAIFANGFMHMKLYKDGVPVITLLAPTILHMVVIFVFQRRIVIPPFAVILFVDILYLVVKGVKSSMYPFEIDGEDDDELADMDDFLDSAE